MSRRTLLIVPLLASVLFVSNTSATPPSPPGWAVVLEPGAGGDHWALVPIISMGTDPGSRPPEPPGWSIVSRPSRTGAQWVIVPADAGAGWEDAPPPEPGSPSEPAAPPEPAAPEAPQITPLPPEPPAPSTPVEQADLVDLEQRIIDRINDARSGAGLPPLQPHPLVTQAARAHSEEMARLDYLSHESPTPQSKSFTDRLKQAGVASFGAGAENIAKGTYPGDPAEGIVQSWLDSPGHRDNIMSNRYMFTGVGVAVSDGAIWSTQVFTSALE